MEKQRQSCLLGYVTKCCSPQTPGSTEEERQVGKPKSSPAPATHKSITGDLSPSTPMYTTQRSTEIRWQQEEPELWTRVNGHPVRAHPRRASVAVSMCETHQNGSPEVTGEHLSGGLLPRGLGDTVGCRGRACWDRTGHIMGFLGLEVKVGKGRDQRGLGRNKHGKTKG